MSSDPSFSKNATSPNRDNSDENDNKRLETLELKMMELENTVAELNSVVIRQYEDIDRLVAMIGQLQQKIEGDETTLPPMMNPADEPPPPHY